MYKVLWCLSLDGDMQKCHDIMRRGAERSVQHHTDKECVQGWYEGENNMQITTGRPSVLSAPSQRRLTTFLTRLPHSSCSLDLPKILKLKVIYTRHTLITRVSLQRSLNQLTQGSTRV